jgi:hypothetical protein
MAKITRTNPEGISKPFSNYSHVVTAEGAQKLVFCGCCFVLCRAVSHSAVLSRFLRISDQG